MSTASFLTRSEVITISRKIRRLTNDYFRWCELKERGALWRGVAPRLQGARKNLSARQTWALQGLNPAHAFPQVSQPPAKTDTAMRAFLIRSALVYVRNRLATRDDEHRAAAETSRLLRALCPELCARVTPALVRNLPQKRKK